MAPPSHSATSSSTLSCLTQLSISLKLLFSSVASHKNTHTHTTHAYTKEEERLCQRHSLGEPQWLHGFSAQPSRPPLFITPLKHIYTRTIHALASHLSRQLIPLINACTNSLILLLKSLQRPHDSAISKTSSTSQRGLLLHARS